MLTDGPRQGELYKHLSSGIIGISLFVSGFPCRYSFAVLLLSACLFLPPSPRTQKAYSERMQARTCKCFFFSSMLFMNAFEENSQCQEFIPCHFQSLASFFIGRLPRVFLINSLHASCSNWVHDDCGIHVHWITRPPDDSSLLVLNHFQRDRAGSLVQNFALFWEAISLACV